jgi:predicted translin family RNA/ssDNA-binding protein
VSQPESVESRLTALEREVARLREQSALAASDAAAARVLATGADRDVSEVRAELRAHTHVLHALRDTQLEQRQMLADQREILADHGQILAQHGQTMAEHGQTLAQHGQTLEELRQAMTEQGQAMTAGFTTVNAGMEESIAGPNAG